MANREKKNYVDMRTKNCRNLNPCKGQPKRVFQKNTIHREIKYSIEKNNNVYLVLIPFLYIFSRILSANTIIIVTLW